MPRGPKGEKRSAHAAMIAKIAAGEIEETPRPSKKVKSGEASRLMRTACGSRSVTVVFEPLTNREVRSR